MVKLLLDSNVSRYTEFLSVTNVLTYINNRLEPVPCSKSDVFSSKNMTILDKRILMRILTICMNTEDDNSFQDFYDKSFCEFLEAQNVPENLIHYIIYAISQGSKRMPYLEGVQRAQIFLSSLGRFGNSPFLWPLYGSSELLQAYCRMCAIYGGIYYLNRGAESLVVNENFLCEGVMSNNMHLQSNHTIISASLAPASYCDSTMLNFISRGILITDRPLYSGAKPGISTFQFPAEDQRNPIMVIELNSDTYSCPNGLCKSLNLQMLTYLGLGDKLRANKKINIQL
ncbi:hypothetical protein AAG570_008345 [Ranatra chinensis]|uniref:Uncharacterized protein n=1 Tax=Ranatra chinensis TaxID=642074 RepID=A0ABD0Y659_9HEMI